MNERLQELADRLQMVPGNRFAYWRWFSLDVRTVADLAKDCGTTGCALGWAATFWPEKWTTTYLQYWGVCPVLIGCGHPITSASIFFDISKEEAEFLFIGNRYEADYTPSQVAVKIETFIRSKREQSTAGTR